MHISHLLAALLFSLSTSVVFAITSKENNRQRFLYGLWVFALFVIAIFGTAWLMFLSHR